MELEDIPIEPPLEVAELELNPEVPVMFVVPTFPEDPDVLGLDTELVWLALKLVPIPLDIRL